MFYFEHMTELAHASAGMVVPEWTVGDRMRKAREHAELNQAAIGVAIGVGRTSIVNYETARLLPTRPVLLAWSLATGVPYEWLCHGDTQPCGPQKTAGQRRSDTQFGGRSNLVSSLPDSGAA
jgi:transcriptional regulator with XRE-family HTH domain